MNGVWAGVWSSLFQGLGTVLARQAFISQVNLDPVLATTIRIASGTVVIWIFARFQGPLGPLLTGSRERKMVKLLLAGTLFGPLLGMICYVSALKYAPAGVVTTITFMNPLIIIPLGAWYYGTRVGISAITGTCLSLAGVILLGFG
jgi:drug/metabolite transporter (DMT)-like permease